MDEQMMKTELCVCNAELPAIKKDKYLTLELICGNLEI